MSFHCALLCILNKEIKVNVRGGLSASLRIMPSTRTYSPSCATKLFAVTRRSEQSATEHRHRVNVNLTFKFSGLEYVIVGVRVGGYVVGDALGTMSAS